MKKNIQYDYCPPQWLKKILRVAKVWGILFFVGITILHAESYSQVKKVSFSVKNVSLLSVLDLIQAQSDYTFLFSSSDIEGIQGISLQVKDMEVNTVLSTCLKGTGRGKEND